MTRSLGRRVWDVISRYTGCSTVREMVVCYREGRIAIFGSDCSVILPPIRRTRRVPLIVRRVVIWHRSQFAMVPQLFQLHAFSFLRPHPQRVVFRHSIVCGVSTTGGCCTRLLEGLCLMGLEAGWDEDVVFKHRFTAAEMLMQRSLFAVPAVGTPMVAPPGMRRGPVLLVWVHFITRLRQGREC
jgi:hypothetical protein